MVRRLMGSALVGAALALCAWPRTASAQEEPGTGAAPPQAPSATPPPAQAPPAAAPGAYPAYPGYPPGQAPPGYGPPGQPAYPPPGYPPGYYPPPGYAPPGYPPAYYAPPGPATKDYVEGEPIPPGYHKEERVRRGAILAGALMAGITYGINVFIASLAEGRQNYEWLYVPVVGGWVWMADQCDTRDNGCTYLVLHNLTHSAGVVLLVYGLAAKRTLLVRDDVGFIIAPARVGSAPGIAVHGEF